MKHQHPLLCDESSSAASSGGGHPKEAVASPPRWEQDPPDGALSSPRWLITGLAAVANLSKMIQLFTIITMVSFVTYKIIMKVNFRSNSATHIDVKEQAGTKAYALLWDLGHIPAPFCAWKVNSRPT